MLESGKNIVPVHLIIKKLTGEISTDETIDLENWKNRSPENLKIFNQYKLIWEQSNQNDLYADIDIDEEWNKFLTDAGLNEEGMFESFKVKSRREKNLSYFTRPLLKIAAAIVFGLFLGYSAVLIYRFSFFEKVVASEVTEIKLPDGSVTTLNVGTKLIYPRNFADDKREIKLNGEAFFEVKPDPDKRFLVESGNLIVEVLGTAFNVEAYKKEDIYKVIVENGHVAAYDKSDSENKSQLYKGDQLIYSKKTNELIKTQSTDPNRFAWMTGIIEFNNTRFSEVAKTLTELYHIRVEVDPVIEDCRITVRFDNKSLDYVLETLNTTMDFGIEKKGNTIIITGEGC